MRPPRAVCVGETMVQLAPPAGTSVEFADTFRLRAAGAESNVALGLRQLGQDVAWAGRIGDDALGRRLLAQFENAGVEVDVVVVEPVRRTGLFITSPGRESSAAIYYRDGSAASALDVDDIEHALACRPHLLHLSGVTPALSESRLRASRYAVDTARRSGALVSFDVNYRRVLWEDREAAARVLTSVSDHSSAPLHLDELHDEAAGTWGLGPVAEREVG